MWGQTIGGISCYQICMPIFFHPWPWCNCYNNIYWYILTHIIRHKHIHITIDGGDNAVWSYPAMPMLINATNAVTKYPLEESRAMPLSAMPIRTFTKDPLSAPCKNKGALPPLLPKAVTSPYLQTSNTLQWRRWMALPLTYETRRSDALGMLHAGR